MIGSRPAVLAALLGIAAASCGSNSGAPDGGPAGDASGDGATSDTYGDGAASDTAAAGPRDAALDGRCPSDVFFGHPCDKTGAECVEEVPTGGFRTYYCVSCGSPLPMPDASPMPVSPGWQTTESCPP